MRTRKYPALQLLCADLAPADASALLNALHEICPGSELRDFDDASEHPCQSERYDAVVLGVSMAAERRDTVLLRVQTIPELSAVPVLALATTRPDEAHWTEGVDALITLPIDPADLAQHARWLARLHIARGPLQTVGASPAALEPASTGTKEAQAVLSFAAGSEHLFFERSIDAIALFELVADETGQAQDYRLVCINPAGEAFVGRPAHELLGKTWAVLAPGAEPPWLQAFADVALGGPQVDLVGQEPLQQRHVRVRAFPVRHGTFGVIFADISSYRAAAHRQALQTRRAQAMLHFPKRAAEQGEQEFMQYALEVAEDLTSSGVSFVHFVGQDESTIELVTWSERTQQEYCDVVHEPHYPVSIWGDAVRNKRPVVFNGGLPQGHAHLERMLTVPTMEGGKVVMLTGVGNAATDYGDDELETVQLISDTVWSIVRRRRAEEALAESEAQLKLALAAANQGVYDLNVQTGTAVVSREYATMLGYEPADFQESNSTWLNRVHPQDRAAVKKIYLDYIAQKVPDYRVEFRMRAKDGRWKWILSIGKIMAFDDEGRPLRMVGTHTDLTDRKRAEEEREALQATLAQADRLASMGMLAAGVAHEINNPLTYVLYCVETLSEDLPQLKEAVQTIELAGGLKDLPASAQAVTRPSALQEMVEQAVEAYSGILRIKEIVRGLGTFSRVEQVELGAVNVHDSIAHALSMATNEIKYRARIVKSLGPVPEVFATEGKLAQVFLNLLLNAAHAIDEGKVEDNEIRIRTWVEDDWVVAEVEDSGGGIAEEDRDHIFDPFFTTKGVGVGSGLGLPLCHSIVAGFGGSIRLVSSVGAPTCFQVRLPARGSQRPTAAQTLLTPRRAVPATRGGRVLIVDDEEGIRRLLSRALGANYQTEAVASGEEALALLQMDTRFDVVLCDLMMPKMSGMDLHARIRAVNAPLAARFVFITGGAFTPGAAQYLAQSAVRRLKKPFDTSEVTALVEEMLAS